MSGGESRTERRGDGERVRFCLACGAVLPFEHLVCAACGHEEAGHPDSPGERVVTCPACLEFLSPTLLFCPACGVEIALVGRPTPPAAARAEERTSGAVPAVCVTLALMAPVSALLALGELLSDGLPGLLP